MNWLLVYDLRPCTLELMTLFRFLASTHHRDTILANRYNFTAVVALCAYI
jgi:hypothetical protein